jgi:hypothetical protein
LRGFGPDFGQEISKLAAIELREIVPQISERLTPSLQ